MDDLNLLPKRRTSSRCNLYGWVSCALLVAFGARADDVPPKIQHFDLPGGDARKQLNLFSQQAGIQLLFDYTQAAGMFTHPVKGDLAPLDALSEMMKGLPLSWTAVNARTLAITLAKKTSAPQPHHWWQRALARTDSNEIPPGQMSQILITGQLNLLNQPQPLGGELIRLDRA